MLPYLSVKDLILRSLDLGMQHAGEDREQHDPLVNDLNLNGQARVEITSPTRVNRLSEDEETLQEVADVVPLLKKRKKEG